MTTKEEKKPKELYKIVLQDEGGNTISEHKVNAIIVLAHPHPDTIADLPKDKEGGYPLINLQIGRSEIVFKLLAVLYNIIPNKLQELTELNQKSKVWTPADKAN